MLSERSYMNMGSQIISSKSCNWDRLKRISMLKDLMTPLKVPMHRIHKLNKHEDVGSWSSYKPI